jgi:hypothetical protein
MEKSDFGLMRVHGYRGAVWRCARFSSLTVWAQTWNLEVIDDGESNEITFFSIRSVTDTAERCKTVTRERNIRSEKKLYIHESRAHPNICRKFQQN